MSRSTSIHVVRLSQSTPNTGGFGGGWKPRIRERKELAYGVVLMAYRASSVSGLGAAVRVGSRGVTGWLRGGSGFGGRLSRAVRHSP